MLLIIKSIIYFIIAGIFEIGGGYFIWIWIKDGRSFWYGVLGAILLVSYGFIPTFQHANFGRVYATYGGIFIILSLLWGWKIDNIKLDLYDLIGATIALIGVAIVMYWPR